MEIFLLAVDLHREPVRALVNQWTVGNCESCLGEQFFHLVVVAP
jgi:hypothetical protein